MESSISHCCYHLPRSLAAGESGSSSKKYISFVQGKGGDQWLSAKSLYIEVLGFLTSSNKSHGDICVGKTCVESMKGINAS